MMQKDGRILPATLQKAGRAYTSIESDQQKAKAHIERLRRLVR